jgi:hypothetical protein
MRRLEILIDLARELSQNQRYDANSGVSQKLFTHYFQSAQDSLQKNLINAKTKFRLVQQVTPVVDGQEQYSYPSDIYLQNIDTLEWSQNNQDWIPLDRSLTKDRQNVRVGYPFGYWTREDGFMLTPPLESGYLRINYIRKVKRLEKRSGKITTVTGTPITAIVLDASEASYDPNYIALYDSITIVGANGVVKVPSIPITGLTTNTINIPNYTLGTGETVAAGDYVLADGGCVNIAEFPDICESFFIKYANYSAKFGDSSQWTTQARDDMAQSFKEVLDSFALLTDDIQWLPIINTDYLSMW